MYVCMYVCMWYLYDSIYMHVRISACVYLYYVYIYVCL